MDLINKFKSKNGNLNNNYKLIYNKLSDEEKNIIQSMYVMYDDLGDKLKSIIVSDYRHCPICDNHMSWKDKNKTCSKDCAKSSLLVNQEKTNLERYGVTNPAKLEEFQIKMQRTNLERYGVTHPLKSKTCLEKLKETNLERYGVDWVSLNQTVWDKQRKPTIERYGFEYSAKNEDVRMKNIQTNLERYGVEHPILNDEIYKMSLNNRQFSKINYIKEKLNIELSLEQSKKLLLSLNKDYSVDFLKEIVNYALYDVKPNYDIIKNEYLDTGFYNALKAYGYTFDSISSQEKEIEEFLYSLNIKFERNTRNIIKPYELDFYIPEHNLAIEFNGTYWHSDKFKNKNYHQMKTKMCNEQGITLIHIYEYMYDIKKDVYNSIIKSKLNLNNRIYARKCILKEVPKQEEKEFLNKYHLQGFTNSKKCYGLYKDDELLTLCSFGKSRFNKKYEYELIRNCTLPNITVVGGLSKLIKHYKKEINKDIICYSDASISYNKNNILTQPNYIWYKNGIVLKRYQTMKHRLNNLLGSNFDCELSESENMSNNGFYKLYDSGNYTTIL